MSSVSEFKPWVPSLLYPTVACPEFNVSWAEKFSPCPRSSKTFYKYKQLIMKPSPFPNLIRFEPKYSPQDPVFKYP